VSAVKVEWLSWVKRGETTSLRQSLSVAGVEGRFVPPASAISQSGLSAATLRLNVSASNLANLDDTSPVGAASAYQPSTVVQAPQLSGGVSAQAVTLSSAQLLAYDPAAAIANEQGLIQKPEIDPVSQITNQLAAKRAFAFNLDALKAAEEDQRSLLDIST
jgi:flagellar basal-body rod protein FlgC